MALLMVMSLIVSVSAYDGYGFSSNNETVKAGDTVELVLTSGTLYNLISVKFSVQFDESVLID